MIYAKINQDKQLKYPPKPLIHAGGATYNPSEEQLLSCGFLPVVETTMPVKDGCYYIPYYEQNGNEIIQKWEEHDIPQPEQSPQDYLWEKLIG